MRSRGAFTLVELLVVMAVIVALIATLVPTLGRARVASRRAKCLTQVRGLSQAMHLYITEFDSLMDYGAWIPPSGIGNLWVEPLTQYGAKSGLRQCPDASSPNPVLNLSGTAEMPWNVPTTSNLQIGAYTFNGYLYKTRATGQDVEYGYQLDNGYDEDNVASDSDDRDGLSPTPLRTSPISVASNYFHPPFAGGSERVPTFADGIWPESFPDTRDNVPADLSRGARDSGMGQLCVARHGKTINISFFDEHAETVSLDKLWVIEWHANWKARSTPVVIP